MLFLEPSVNCILNFENEANISLISFMKKEPTCKNLMTKASNRIPYYAVKILVEKQVEAIQARGLEVLERANCIMGFKIFEVSI